MHVKLGSWIMGAFVGAVLVGSVTYAGAGFVYEYRAAELATDEQRELIAEQKAALDDATKQLATLQQKGEVRGTASAARPSAPTPSVVSVPVPAPSKEVTYKYVIGDTAYWVPEREAPVGQLSKGTKVEYLREENTWAVVRIDGKEYLMIRSYLADSMSLDVDIADIIKEWKPFVVYIECEFTYSNGVRYAAKSGSGMDYDGVVITNKHVLTDDEGYGPSSCTLVFTNGTRITEPLSSIKVATNDDDWGSITISNKAAYTRPKSPLGMYGCYGGPLPAEGDEVLVLGYPGIGSQTSLTATRGIISAIDGKFYVTDAKIDHGNSGGVAILLRRNCYMGIPTFVIKGELESLGRILDFRAITIVGRG